MLHCIRNPCSLEGLRYHRPEASQSFSQPLSQHRQWCGHQPAPPLKKAGRVPHVNDSCTVLTSGRPGTKTSRASQHCHKNPVRCRVPGESSPVLGLLPAEPSLCPRGQVFPTAVLNSAPQRRGCSDE